MDIRPDELENDPVAKAAASGTVAACLAAVERLRAEAGRGKLTLRQRPGTATCRINSASAHVVMAVEAALEDLRARLKAQILLPRHAPLLNWLWRPQGDIVTLGTGQMQVEFRSPKLEPMLTRAFAIDQLADPETTSSVADAPAYWRARAAITDDGTIRSQAYQAEALTADEAVERALRQAHVARLIFRPRHDVRLVKLELVVADLDRHAAALAGARPEMAAILADRRGDV